MPHRQCGPRQAARALSQVRARAAQVRVGLIEPGARPSASRSSHLGATEQPRGACPRGGGEKPPLRDGPDVRRSCLYQMGYVAKPLRKAAWFKRTYPWVTARALHPALWPDGLGGFGGLDVT